MELEIKIVHVTPVRGANRNVNGAMSQDSTAIFSFFFQSSGGCGKIKLELTIQRIFIMYVHAVCQSTLFWRREKNSDTAVVVFEIKLVI